MSGARQPTDASIAFADALRRGLKTLDRTTLDWVAEGFAWEKFLHDDHSLEKILDEVLAHFPTCAADVLGMGPSSGPFECYFMAALVAHCGLGEDFTHVGPLEKTLIVAGNATIRGPLIANTENWIFVTGDLTADAILTAADFIVGGSVHARDYMIGVNGWEQSLWIKDRLETPLLVTCEYMHTIGDRGGVGKELDSEDDPEFAATLATFLEPIAAHDIAEAWPGIITTLGDRITKGASILRAPG